jgi:hypothetical protein
MIGTNKSILFAAERWWSEAMTGESTSFLISEKQTLDCVKPTHLQPFIYR